VQLDTRNRSKMDADFEISGLYTDESPGLKVDPVVVLVLSLVFIFSVVALHSTSPIFSPPVPQSMTDTGAKQSLPRSPASSPAKQVAGDLDLGKLYEENALVWIAGRLGLWGRIRYLASFPTKYSGLEVVYYYTFRSMISETRINEPLAEKHI
jgi:hypothetical protein